MSDQEKLDKAVEAALRLAELRAWDTLTLAEIAAEAGYQLSDFHGLLDTYKLSARVDPMLDQAMSEGALDPSETPRNRLFDVLMMRFEAMEERRDGLISFMRWRDSCVSGLALRVRARQATARWALICAGLDGTPGPGPGLQRLGLAWAIARADSAWRRETSSDLTATMACLDAELIRLESRLKRFRRRPRETRQEASPDKSDDSL